MNWNYFYAIFSAIFLGLIIWNVYQIHQLKVLSAYYNGGSDAIDCASTNPKSVYDCIDGWHRARFGKKICEVDDTCPQ